MSSSGCAFMTDAVLQRIDQITCAVWHKMHWKNIAKVIFIVYIGHKFV